MNTTPLQLRAPLDEAQVRALAAGTEVRFDGVLYTARDAAHQRMMEALDRGEPLPFPIEGAVIYYVGPSPGAPGQVLGSAGPTTSSRMDSYAPRLIALGLRGMIGKGERGAAVVGAMVKHGAVYFAATGGAGALLGKRILSAEIVAYPELGAEAVRRLEVADFPAVVAQDAAGRTLFRH